MTDCDIVAELTPVAAIGAALGTPATITAALAVPSAITAGLGTPQAITAALGAPGAISAALAAPGAITASLAEVLGIEASLGDDMQPYLFGIERAAERARRDVKKLAAYTTSVNVPGTSLVEMPTGLVLYPSFRDTGFLEINLGGAHANMNGETVTIALMLGPAGSLAQVATITSPPINPTSAVGNFQFEFFLRLKSQGPTSHNFSGYFAWNDASGPQLSPIIGRLVTTGAYTGFGDPGNGDEGDVEVRVDVSLSASGPTLNVRNYVIEQHSPRSLSQ